MSNEEKILRSLELLKDIGYKSDSIRAIKHLPAQEGKYRDYPDDVHPALREALVAKGYTSLFSHQRSSWEALREARISSSSHPRPPERRSATTCRSSTPS